MPVRILRPSRLFRQAVVENFRKHVGLDERLTKGIPLGQDFFLFELVQSFSLLDAGLNSRSSVFQHLDELAQIVLGAERAVAGNDLYVVRHFRQDFFIAGDHALHAAAAVEVDEGKHSAVKEIIAHMDDVGLREKDHAVAIGVSVGKVDGADVFSVQVDGNFIFKGDDRQRDFGCGRSVSESALAAGLEALAHVFLRDDGRLLAEMRIAAGVVAMPVGVDHEFDRLVCDALECRLDFVGERQELIVNHDDAVVAHAGANVAAQTLQHVDGSGNFLNFDLHFAEVLALSQGWQGGQCKQDGDEYSSHGNGFPHGSSLVPYIGLDFWDGQY